MTEAKRGGEAVTDPLVTTYGYGAVGNVETITVTEGAAVLRETTNSYDPKRHWLVEVENKDGAGNLLSTFTYTRRADGQIMQVDESVRQPDGTAVTTTAEYTYDALDRLTKEEVDTSAAGGDYLKEYTLDLAGNRTKLVETREGQSPVTTSYAYDERDRLLTEVAGSQTIAYGYDANGSLTTRTEDGVLQSTQVWDLRGRLIALKDDSGATIAEYGYTPDGIRSSATENGTTTRYVIDALSPSGYAQAVEEWSSGENGSPILLASYVYGAGLDPISQWRAGQGVNLYLPDGHSGVRQAIDLAAAVLLAQRFDATLGQYYLRARFYDPRSGRFTSMDPFRGTYLLANEINRYVYAGSNPVNAIDPSGLFLGLTGISARLAIGALVIGFAAGVAVPIIRGVDPAVANLPFAHRFVSCYYDNGGVIALAVLEAALGLELGAPIPKTPVELAPGQMFGSPNVSPSTTGLSRAAHRLNQWLVERRSRSSLAERVLPHNVRFIRQIGRLIAGARPATVIVGSGAVGYALGLVPGCVIAAA